MQAKHGRLSENKKAVLPSKEKKTPKENPPAKDTPAFRGSIGVSIKPVTDEAAHTLNIKPARGALIVGVDENGPAKAASIELNDVIVKVGSQDVYEFHALARIVADAPIGTDVAITIIRKGRELTKTVTIGCLEDAYNQTSFTPTKGSGTQEMPVAIDPVLEAATKHLAPGLATTHSQQQAAPNLSPPRFGKRRSNDVSDAAADRKAKFQLWGFSGRKASETRRNK